MQCWECFIITFDNLRFISSTMKIRIFTKLVKSDISIRDSSDVRDSNATIK